MRIAVLTEYYPDAGNPASGVYVHARAWGYRKAGHAVRVYRVRQGQPDPGEQEGVSVLAADAETIRSDIASFDPEVLALHTAYPGRPHTRLAESLAVPRVVWIHGYEAMFTALHGYRRGFERLLSLLHDVRKLWRLRRSLAKAAAVVYVSAWMRSTAEKSMRFRHPTTRVIPNPVDTDRFRPSERSRANRRMRGLALRGLRRKCGLDTAVEAYGDLQETELTIVGTGPEADRLRSQIDRAHAAVRLEEKSVRHAQVPELIAGYDYFVAPSRNETQCVAMCEAMACGLPVVATRAGGIPEYVRDGVDGYLVGSDDPLALRGAVLRLVSDPERARAMGDAARGHVEEKCSSLRVIPAELDVLAAATSGPTTKTSEPLRL